VTALAHLRRLLRGAWFRRLFAVRLASQLTDGVFQVAIASYALFAQDRPSAAAIAAALAVVLLPFSVLGPFAGVLLDRWSRRQVLVWANLSRVGIVAAVAAVVAADLPQPVFYGVVLGCLSVNRFLLAGLSAALPHTVERSDLVTANALTPTSGTLAFVAGLGVGGVVRASAGGHLTGELRVLLVAAALYGVAGALALRIPRDLLGPDFDPDRPAVRDAVRNVVRGLADGLRHLRERPAAASALAVVGSQRYWFGIASVSLVLLFRNYFHGPHEADAAFADLSRAAMVGGAGFLAAALLTPSATERWRPQAWAVALLVGAGVVQVFPGCLYTRAGLDVTVFALGLAAQGVKIVADTVVQAGVDDAFRGRVFSLYDVLFNVTFVAAAATAAVLLPRDGRSVPVLLLMSAGYLSTALGYALADRRLRTAPAPRRSRAGAG
jgi:MFS family permease